MRFSLYIQLILLALISSCGSSEVIISSEPIDAKVSIRVLGDESSTKNLGATPLTLDEDTVEALHSDNGEVRVLKIEKEGYMPETLILPDFGKSKAELKFSLKTNNLANIIEKIDNVGNQLFQAHKLINRGSFDESINLLTALNGKYPNSSLISEFLAGAYFLKKNKSKSLMFYEQAYKNNPDNVEAYKMIKHLEAELAVKRPGIERSE